MVSHGATDLCCPLCRSSLQQTEEAYHCDSCERRFPILAGIADLRVYPDPYLDIEADREKAYRLQEQAAGTDFKGLVEYYWSISQDTPAKLSQRFTLHAFNGLARGRLLVSALRQHRKDRNTFAAIELGCRSGGLLVAMAEKFPETVGIDIALRPCDAITVTEWFDSHGQLDHVDGGTYLGQLVNSAGTLLASGDDLRKRLEVVDAIIHGPAFATASILPVCCEHLRDLV